MSLTLATAGCEVDDQTNQPAAPATDDGAEPPVESAPDDSGGTVQVFVFAENEAEETFYETLRSSFEAETGVSVDLEVRLP